MSQDPTGADLVHQLWIAARAEGQLLGDYVKPLTSSPSQFIRQLRAAERPSPMTARRVEALITGAPIPKPSSRVEAVRATGEEARAEIERKRAIAEAASERRWPGETLHAAVRRLERELYA